jgi:hypothetical protein
MESERLTQQLCLTNPLEIDGYCYVYYDISGRITRLCGSPVGSDCPLHFRPGQGSQLFGRRIGAWTIIHQPSIIHQLT